MPTLRFTIGGAAFQTFSIFLDGNLVPAHQVGSSPGYQTVDMTVSVGTHKIWCNDPNFDINVSVVPVANPSNPTPAENGFRLLSTLSAKSKTNGFWFDTTDGFISPTIKSASSICWHGYMIQSGTVQIYDTQGNLKAQGVDPNAYPDYLLVSSLPNFYNINTNIIDYTSSFPSTCPAISRLVTVTAIDGSTMSGIMSLLDYSQLSKSNINQPPYIVNASGSSFFTSVSNSTENPTIDASSVLNFITSHATPIAPPVPYTVFQPGQPAIDVTTNDPIALSSIVNSDLVKNTTITTDLLNTQVQFGGTTTSSASPGITPPVNQPIGTNTSLSQPPVQIINPPSNDLTQLFGISDPQQPSTNSITSLLSGNTGIILIIGIAILALILLRPRQQQVVYI